MSSKTAVIIPARMSSSRFPGKPKAMIAGTSMIERVWRIGKATNAAEVFVATDDTELQSFCEQFGASVIMTSPDCLTGTDRVAEATRTLPDEYDIIFNLQGDSPIVPPWILDSIIHVMQQEPEVQIATPMVKLQGQVLQDFIKMKKQGSTTGTTVTFDTQGYALYFSKGFIPFLRDPAIENPPVYRHIGLYCYRREALFTFATLPEGMFEKVEKLEQLRAMENGIRVRAVEVDYRGRTTHSVDNPEDVALVENIIATEGEIV